MRRFILFLVLAGGLVPAAPVHSQNRPFFDSPRGWFSADKPKHLVLSGAAVGLIYGAANGVGASDRMAWTAAVGGAAAIGAAKEWHDWQWGKSVDPKDLAWDAAGIAVGVAVTAVAGKLIRGGKAGSEAPRPVAAPPLPVLQPQPEEAPPDAAYSRT